ncbi:entry exclusion protein TrbK [Brucella cytisi]|uniref:entry exclusion protein TrbK n=1 Tax=Brucella cytisi TaxID=407152 RepID=UPI00313D37A5
MQKTSFITGLIIGIATVFASFLVLERTTASRASLNCSQTSVEERRKRRERFFNANPDHDFRSGQKMKPRW